MLPAQENNRLRLSLEACVKMAVERNINIKTGLLEQEKSVYKVSESYSAFLPKINATGSFTDYFKLPTTLLPGEIVGMPGTKIPAEMGTKFNTAIGASFSMILYNQTAITALQLSKKLSELSELSLDKACETLAFETAKLYYLAITTNEQRVIVEDNIARLKSLSDIVKLLVDNGVGKQVDYDRISVSLENLRTQLSTVEASYEQQINMLKYILDMPIDSAIELTDKPETALVKALELSPDFSEHIDMKLLEQQKEVNMLNVKTINSGYLPSLTLTAQMNAQGLRDEFKNYFKDSDENKWYGSSFFGVTLSVPVFDGWEKRSKSRQAKIDFRKTEALIEDTHDKFVVDYRNALNNYHNNKTNVERQKQNIELATKVYDETALKYKEGMASMSDLLQDEMSLSSAQSSYLTALYNFKETELKLMSLNGEINQLIKN